MTTLTARLPRNPKQMLLAITIALFMLALGFGLGFMLTRPVTLGEVTVKPCATCPSCVCTPLLGGPRCGCPQ
jgi:hypothetical protein